MYLAAANHENAPVLDLPGEEEGATGLDWRVVFFAHVE